MKLVRTEPLFHKKLVFMTINGERAAALSSAVLVFFYTYFLGALYVGGDQEHYRSVYEVSGSSSFLDSYLYYRGRIQSDEVGHFLITWFASQIFEKDLFNAFANSIFAFFSVRLLSKWGAHTLLALVISVFGYYHLAMYVSAERLKYASIFFVIGAFYFQRNRLTYLAFLISIITHLQYLVMIAAVFSGRFSAIFLDAYRFLRVRKSDITIIMLLLLFLILISIVFYDHIVYKIKAYHQVFGFTEYFRILLFFFGALFYSKEWVKVLATFSVLFLMVGLVGGDRVNLFGYFIFLFFALQVRKGFNFGVIATFIYYFVGWIEYVSWVVDCGINRPC